MSRRAQRWALAGCLLAEACASGPPPRPELPDACPVAAAELPPTVCPEGVGASRSAPLEWGPGAGAQLMYGRLVCAGGASPTARRVGDVGPPPTPSDAALTPFAPGPEVLTEWHLGCPEGGGRVLFSSAHRCGVVCAPVGFAFLPAEVHAAMKAVEASHAAGAPAVAEAEALAQRAPAYEASHRLLADALTRAGRASEAVAPLEAALAIHPGRVPVLIALAAARLAAGDADGAEAAFARAFSRAGSPGERGEALCVGAVIAAERGQEAEVEQRVEAACSLQASCC